MALNKLPSQARPDRTREGEFSRPARSGDLRSRTPLPAPVASTQAKRRAGRFERWHLEPEVMAEEEGWLVTYLDVITLLLVMMVVMLSFSGPGKRGEPAKTVTVGATASSALTPAPLAGMPDLASPIPMPVPTAPAPAVLEPEADAKPALPEGLALEQLDKNIEVIVSKGSVSFRISSELLFSSGDASLSGPGLGMMSRLVPALNSVPSYRIVVEGHTDNVPIQTERFPSNWELSTGRAASVVRQLQSLGIDPSRMRATGYADTRPIASNDNLQDRAANRHVEVILEAPR